MTGFEFAVLSLLGALALFLLIIIFRLNAALRILSIWHDQWGRGDAHASDYHAKEILKVGQEIAHMIAMERAGREEKR